MLTKRHIRLLSIGAFSMACCASLARAGDSLADRVGVIASQAGMASVEAAPVSAPPIPSFQPVETAAPEEVAIDPWHKRLAQLLGIHYPCAVETKRLGQFYNPTEKLTFDDGQRRESAVFKRYSHLTNVKYYLSKALLPNVPLTLGADEIFKNGLAMMEKFRNAGFKTLEVIATDPKKRIVVTKFLEATSLGEVARSALQGDPGSLQVIERLASAFAAIHRNGLCLNDPKADNIMLANGEFYFIDLDQASVGGNNGWDIADFFYFSIAIDRMPGKPQAWSLLARSFLQGYKAGGGDISSIKKALGREFLVPFGHSIPMGGWGPIHAVRREMKKAAGEDPSTETDNSSQ